MICYRDRTYCPGDGCTEFDECPRALTDEVRAKAESAGLLVSLFTNPKELKCYATKEDE